MDTPKRPKLLVLFFSRSGTTRNLAEHIAHATGADVEELREQRSRRGPIGWLRSGFEGTYRRSAKTLPLRRNLRDYDVVFVGSPTWSRSLSSPVRGFLEEHAAALSDVALFATCGSRGATDVIAQMKELLKKPPLATLTMLESDVKRSSSVQAGELTEATLRAWEAQERRASPSPASTHG